MGRIGFGVAGQRLYAVIQSKEGISWRSDDAGAHWRPMTRDTLVNQRPFYMSRLAVDPSNPDHVFFSSEDLIETRDGGKTYRDVPAPFIRIITDSGSRATAAASSRPTTAARRSRSMAEDWDWRFNVVLAQVYRIGYDEENPYHVCGGIQDNDSYCGPSDHSARSGSRTPTGATSATTATALGFGRSRTIRRRSGTSASTSSTVSSASST